MVGSWDAAVDLLEQNNIGIVVFEDGDDTLGGEASIDADGFVNVVGQHAEDHRGSNYTMKPLGAGQPLVWRRVTVWTLSAGWTLSVGAWAVAADTMAVMSMDELRARLERLNRGSLGDRIVPAPDVAAPGSDDRGAAVTNLEAILPGREADADGASFYLIERQVGRCWKPGGEVFARFRAARADDGAGRRGTALHPDLGEACGRDEGSLLFVDLETCGFSGTPVFLIGAMYVARGDLLVVQLLARSYEEEVGILRYFSRLARQRPFLVTFNGKAFDWPFLSDRATVHHVGLPDPAGHCDLLYAARRRFRAELPDCKLQTLERFVCGRRRMDDIAGSAIPAAYHAFVRTGDARQVHDIVQHNFLDLVTMADVLARLVSE